MTWHDFLIIETSQDKHQGMTWLKYITIHPRINIGLQYIRNRDEYIPKLQLHQHFVLTRKVFSRHNFHHWSSSLVLLVICIFKSSSYSSHIHLQVIFYLDLDHHSIWIIVLDHSRSGTSSLDHTQSGTSSLDHTWSRTSLLDLDHHSIWINITGSGSSLDLDHHWLSSLDLDHHC